MSIKYLCGIDVDNGLLYTDTANDRVGIGTASPTRKLQVIGTDGAAKFYYNSSFTNAQYSVMDVGMMTSGTATDGFGPKITFRMGGNGYDGFVGGTIGTVRNGADNSHNLTFATSNAGSTTTKMTITNAGDVGIGTTGPGAKLDVVGTIRTTNASGNQASLTGSSLTFPDASTTTIGANVANFNPGTKNLAIGSSSTKWNTVTMTCNTFQIVTGFGQVPFKVTNGLVEIDKILEIKEQVNIENLANATSDTDKFLVSDPGQSDRVKYRTGAQLAADIGAVTGGPFLPLAGGTMTGDIRFNDNVYARFGATGTGDLIIGHADFGSPYSVILENGSGDLKIQATNLLLESANGETYIDCNFNSSVDLYHNNVKKFATLSTGASVTGKLGIDTTSPNTQLEVFNNNDQAATLRLSTSANSSQDVCGEISFAFDGTTVGSKIQSIINANEDGADLKLDSAITTLTGDLTVTGGDISLSGTGRIQGVDTVSASTDAANKAYVDAHTPANTQTIITSNFSDDTNTMNSLRIPFNTLSETTSNQYYNSFDCPADGSIKRVRFHNTSGSASTNFNVTFQIYKNASYSSPTTSSAIPISSGQVEWEPSNYSFSKGDSLQFGYSKSALSKYMRGVSATIIIEFEQV